MLVVILAIDLWSFAFRRPAMMGWLAVMLQIGIGLAAGVSLDRAFGRWSVVAAIPLSAIVILTAFSVPGDSAWIIDVLTWAPFIMLLTLGAIAAIPPALYEAAAVDRAGAWFVLGNVTMPLLAPLLLGGIVFRVIDALNGHRSLEFVLMAYALLLAAIGIGELVERYRASAGRGTSR